MLQSHGFGHVFWAATLRQLENMKRLLMDLAFGGSQQFECPQGCVGNMRREAGALDYLADFGKGASMVAGMWLLMLMAAGC